MDSILQILKRLNDSGVEYVLIGQMAAIAHGSMITTGDIDICVAANQENFSRIVGVLMDARPCYRMRPDKPPLNPDHPWLRHVKNLYIRCDLGQLDVLGELPGIGSFDEIKHRTVEADLEGIKCRVLDIPTLIASKRHANREKDRRAVTELELILKQFKH